MKQDRPLSYSALKQLDKSPNHLLAYWDRDLTPSSAQIKGTLIHTLTLEPDTFDSKYAIFEGKVKRGKAYDEFVEENIGKTIISQKDYDEADDIVRAVWNNPQVKVLFNETVEVEKHIEWNYRGIRFKGFIDGVGTVFNFDLKSCASSEPQKFASDCFKFGYPMQGAMYNMATGKEDFFIIAVENAKPYNVTVFKMTDELLEYGKQELDRLIDVYEAWDGEPESYTDIVLPLDFPSWFQKQRELVDIF